MCQRQILVKCLILTFSFFTFFRFANEWCWYNRFEQRTIFLKSYLNKKETNKNKTCENEVVSCRTNISDFRFEFFFIFRPQQLHQHRKMWRMGTGSKFNSKLKLKFLTILISWIKLGRQFLMNKITKYLRIKWIIY